MNLSKPGASGARSKRALRGKSEEKFKLKRIAIGIFETCLARCFCRLMYRIYSIKRRRWKKNYGFVRGL